MDNLTAHHVDTVNQIGKTLLKATEGLKAPEKKKYLENVAKKLTASDSKKFTEQVDEELAELEAQRKALEGNKIVANVFKDLDGMKPEAAKDYRAAIIAKIGELAKGK